MCRVEQFLNCSKVFNLLLMSILSFAENIVTKEEIARVEHFLIIFQSCYSLFNYHTFVYQKHCVTKGDINRVEQFLFLLQSFSSLFNYYTFVYKKHGDKG